MRRLTLMIFTTLTLVLALAACNGIDDVAEPDPDDYDVAQQPDDAAAMFVNPEDGATVSSPVAVELAAEGVDIVPADAPAVGEAHFHIMVAVGCVGDGEFVPGPSDEATDEGYLHFGDGSTEADIDLEPGTYELCLQIADGAHRTFGGTDAITITVE